MSAREFDVRPHGSEKDGPINVFDVGVESLLHLDAVLTLLAMVDGKQLGDRFGSDSYSLAIWLGTVANICQAFSDEALKRLDQTEKARRQAIESAEILFDGSDPVNGRGQDEPTS